VPDDFVQEEPMTPPEPDRKHEPASSRDSLDDADLERRARREGRNLEGRPLNAEETAPGERGDGPYGDSEPRVRGDRPGT
jgi:hypothetical protein